MLARTGRGRRRDFPCQLRLGFHFVLDLGADILDRFADQKEVSLLFSCLKRLDYIAVLRRGPWSLKFMLMLLANPLVLVYLGRLAWIKQQPSQWDNMEFMFKVAQETIEGIFSVIVENYLFGSWMFTIVTAVLYPMWMQFWALLHFDE